MKNPRYINLVGPDGSGKDTIYELILNDYKGVVQHREPGGTPIAERIREIILSPTMDRTARLLEVDRLLAEKDALPLTKMYLEKARQEIDARDINGLAEVYLYAASRAQTNKELVLPALAEGKRVFGRRSIACSMSYQAGARGEELKRFGIEDPVSFVWEENQQAIQDCLPEFEFYFDVPTEIAMKRIAGRTEVNDRLDNETEEFHRKSREGYLQYYQNFCPYPYQIIDASQSIETVYAEVLRTLRQFDEQKE